MFGVVGRKAGTAKGYRFSKGMKGSGLTWDEATLDKFLKKLQTGSAKNSLTVNCCSLKAVPKFDYALTLQVKLNRCINLSKVCWSIRPRFRFIKSITIFRFQEKSALRIIPELTNG